MVYARVYTSLQLVLSQGRETCDAPEEGRKWLKEEVKERRRQGVPKEEEQRVREREKDSPKGPSGGLCIEL